MYKANSGTVSLLGETYPLNEAGYELGYMPQDEALYDDLTADQNLRFFGSLYGMSKAAMDEAIPRVLTLARLGDTGRKLVTDFSGGMKRRLSLAIALLHNPKILVLDEPTVGLDPEHRILLWQGFRELANSGSCMLITTHVMDEAANCDEVVMLREGSIIASGSPDELIRNSGTENLESAFLSFGDKTKQGGEANA
jgi:ABC-2 type transport system ATP-binding protein